MRMVVAELDIDDDDLLEALNAAEPTEDPEEGWHTVEELMRTSGWGVTTMRKRLKERVEEGTVEYKKVARTSLLGARYYCNAFRVKPQ